MLRDDEYRRDDDFFESDEPPQLGVRERCGRALSLLFAPLRGLLAWMLFVIAWPVHSIRLVVGAWIQGAGRRFWLSLPAILVALGSLIFVTIGLITQPWPETERRYMRAAEQAVLEKNWPAAELYLQKVAYNNERNPRAQYLLGLVAAEQGDMQLAQRRMHRIAPADRGGYGPAHSWLVTNRLLSNKPLEENEKELVTHHLEQTVEQQPDDIQARLILAAQLARAGNHTGAIEQIQSVVHLQPALHLQIGNLYKAQKKERLAALEFDRAAEKMSEILAVDPERTAARVILARARIQQQDLEGAEKVVLDGLARTKDRRLRVMLALINVLRFDREYANDPARLPLALPHLAVASRHAPALPALLGRLALLAHQTDMRSQIKEQLLELVVGGRATATVHMVLGTIAADNGDFEAAALHFDLGLKQRPRMVSLLNNLAWSLAQKDEPELERALELINTALKAAPRRIQFVDTRAEIYAKMGRWRDCISDLERLLPSAPTKRGSTRDLPPPIARLAMRSLRDIMSFALSLVARLRIRLRTSLSCAHPFGKQNDWVAE